MPASSISEDTRWPAYRPSSWAGSTRSLRGQNYVTEKKYAEIIPSREKLPRICEKEAWKAWPDSFGVRIRGSQLGPQQARDFQFIVSENRAPKGWNDGDCFWRTLAMVFYGDSAYFPYVKAEHYYFLRDLESAGTKDPNHGFWKDISSSLNNSGLNILEQLATGSEQAGADMFELTAHLYRVCVVLFIFKDSADWSRPPEIHYIGARNREQIFVAADVQMTGDSDEFTGHLMPMRPDVENPEEFRWPDLDLHTWMLDHRQYRWNTPTQRKREGKPVAAPLTRRAPFAIGRADIEHVTGIRVETRVETLRTDRTRCGARKRVAEALGSSLSKRRRQA